jgi:hypothetical protein
MKQRVGTVVVIVVVLVVSGPNVCLEWWYGVTVDSILSIASVKPGTRRTSSLAIMPLDPLLTTNSTTSISSSRACGTDT